MKPGHDFIYKLQAAAFQDLGIQAKLSVCRAFNHIVGHIHNYTDGSPLVPPVCICHDSSFQHATFGLCACVTTLLVMILF
jgi:hypothetical protein